MARYILTSLLPRVPQRARRSEAGQMLAMVALCTAVLLGMAAMAVDFGSYAVDRRQLQNKADSIALAASIDLPDAAAAQASAQAWAAHNGVSWSDVSFQVVPAGPGQPNPRAVVELERSHRFAFMQVLGVKERDVGARAVAIKTSPGGAASLTPWAVLQSTVDAAAAGDTIVMKYDATNPTTGNFGAITIDARGADAYRTTIEDRSTSSVCAVGVTGCTETSQWCDGSACPSETGNMVGPTRQAVDYMMSSTDSHCDTFGEVFSGPVDGKYTVNRQCNPWLEGSYTSNRVLIVPVVASLCNGSCALTITSFALFWLEGYGSGGCTGNACLIKGRFVQADVNLDALAGIYDPNSLIHFVRLVE